MSKIFGGGPSLPDPIPFRDRAAEEEARRKQLIAASRAQGAQGQRLGGGTGGFVSVRKLGEGSGIVRRT